MLKWVLLLCLFGNALAYPSPIARSKEEVEELKTFLMKTQHSLNGGITLKEAMARNPKASPWENSGRYQGDIVLVNEEIEDMVSEYAGNASSRNGLVLARHRWPGATIVYDIAPNTFNNQQLNLIQRAANFFSATTCTRWIRRTSQRDYVLITGFNDGCYATVGYWQNFGPHTLNLAWNCFNELIIIHEMLHSAGFHHMHQTFNRYDWIWINWQNVLRGMEHNFNVFSSQEVTMLGLPYEYASNQHYGAWAFSSNGFPTIGARFNTGGQMGQLQFISGLDIHRLARLYNCPGSWSLEVRPEDINKPFSAEYAKRLRDAAEKELRQKAEVQSRQLVENVLLENQEDKEFEEEQLLQIISNINNNNKND